MVGARGRGATGTASPPVVGRRLRHGAFPQKPRWQKGVGWGSRYPVTGACPPPGPVPVQPEISVAKPNYAFEKRQRELEKKRKKQEKEARKTTPQPAPLTAPPQEQA